jgi:DNA-binding NtrC family response regulator
MVLVAVFRILIADVSLMDARYRAIFQHDALRFVRTVGEAMRALDVGRYNLLIIGMHFDESKMFELIWHIKAKQINTPVVCVHGVESALANVRGVETAARALGACEFFDLRKLPEQSEGIKRLRERFIACASRTGDGGPTRHRAG